LKFHIKYSYHNNWIINNLPSASLGINNNGAEQIHYAGGFPIGCFYTKLDDAKEFKKEKKHKKKELLNIDVYVYNHVNIIL